MCRRCNKERCQCAAEKCESCGKVTCDCGGGPCGKCDCGCEKEKKQ